MARSSVMRDSKSDFAGGGDRFMLFARITAGMSSKESCRDELRLAVRQLSDCGLSSAAMWAAEQVIAIELEDLHFTPSNTRFQSGSSSIRRRYYTNQDQMGKKSIFLRCYSLFLVTGEKRKEEEMIEVEDSLGKSDIVNKELVYLVRELSTMRKKNGSIDPFGLYLYGLVLKEKGSESMACTILVELWTATLGTGVHEISKNLKKQRSTALDILNIMAQRMKK
ncbi:hypothetical protein MLD38_037085 [Melastoma candidum]|uniref:Uncharacterized protein n=1 Tax=Melastoma candidum TaxID=119954 RepID=A0ACB9LM79_9MYRT|nr:hypothetical protein MLD38_037085 [Melastoma candidum]